MEIAIEDTGSGKPILLLHAFPLSGWMWGSLSAELINEGYRVITPDFPGFGKTVFPFEWSIDDFVADLRLALTERGVESVNICGLSMGGYAAFSFFRQFPDLVESLIFCDTISASEPEKNLNSRKWLIEGLRVEGAKILVKNLLPKLISDKSFDENPDLVSSLSEQLLACDPDSAIRAINAIIQRKDSDSLLTAIDKRTLFIFGEDDKITASEIGTKMSLEVANSKIALLPNVGHLSNLEAPSKFNQIVKEFLSGV